MLYRLKERLFLWLVLFARWAAWLGAYDPKDVDLWIEHKRKELK